MIIALALAVIAGVSVLLWLPVLMDHVNGFLSRLGNKYGWHTAALGLGLLIIGLVVHVHFLAIAGGIMAGVVIVAAIVDNY